MKQKTCVELHIPHYNPQTTNVWSLIELASRYTVPLSAVNGRSHLTKLTTSKEAGTADLIRKFSNRPITFELNRIGRPIRIRISKLRRSLNNTLLLLLLGSSITITMTVTITTTTVTTNTTTTTTTTFNFCLTGRVFHSYHTAASFSSVDLAHSSCHPTWKSTDGYNSVKYSLG